MELEIKHREDQNKGAFYIEENGIQVGEMFYLISGPGKIIIERTVVSDKLRGHGAGNQLVDAIVSYARDNSYMISSICTFAKSVLDKAKAYHDVYDPESN